VAAEAGVIEQYIPLAVALGIAFVVWKMFAGFVKFLLIAALLCGGGYVWWTGMLDGVFG
jgi:hypothetical protein